MELNTKAEAVEIGRQMLEALARERMKQNYVDEPLLDFSVEDKSARAGDGQVIHLETQLPLRATGRPNVEQKT